MNVKYVSPAGRVFDFSEKGYCVDTVLGLGATDAEYVTEEFRHGAGIRNFHYEPRIISVIFTYEGCSEAEYNIERKRLSRMFAPSQQHYGRFQPGKLYINLKGVGEYYVNVYLESSPLLPYGGSDGTTWCINDEVRFVTDKEPMFVSTEIKEYIYSPKDAIDFATYVPGGAGQSVSINETICLTNDGDFEANPIIYIKGPMENLVIENLDAGNKIVLDRTVTATELITIDLRDVNRTAVSSSGQNVIGSVTDAIGFACFNIGADPTVFDGDNKIRITADNVDPIFSRITFRWQDRCLGL